MIKIKFLIIIIIIIIFIIIITSSIGSSHDSIIIFNILVSSESTCFKAAVALRGRSFALRLASQGASGQLCLIGRWRRGCILKCTGHQFDPLPES